MDDLWWWILLGAVLCLVAAWLGRRALGHLAAKRRARRAALVAQADAQRRAADAAAQRRERQAAADQEAARAVAAEAARADKARRAAAAAAQAEAERLAAQEVRAEFERLQAERAQAARVDAERLEAARVETARVEAARIEAARLAAAHIEALRIEAAQAEAARIEAARHAAEEEARALVAAAAAAAVSPLLAKNPEDTLVMVADDSKLVRVKTGRLLAQHRYRVAYAVDGLDAAQQLQGSAPDVVITDVDMPGLDGFELTRLLRQNPATAHIPVIMITAADDRHRDDADRAGVSVLLGKPYPEDELIAHIRRAVGQPVSAPAPTPA